MTDKIKTEKIGRVGVIRFDGGEKINVIDKESIHQLSAAIDDFESDDEVGCIVWRSFSVAGVSILEMSELSYPHTYLDDFIDAKWERFSSCRKPVLALVDGYTLGGGCELVMMCDIILASDKAKFGQPELGLGIPPGIGGTQRMVRAVGKAKAMDICLTGRMIDATEAERIGLISRLIDRESLEEEGLKLAEEIANKPRVAQLMVKELVNQGFEMSLSNGVKVERRMFQSSFATEDQKEGMMAFLDKRNPEYKNR